MKQTAVEYAVEKLEKFIPSGNQIVIAIILEESKRMEKKQKGYSEEDMYSLMDEYQGWLVNTTFETVLTFREWFETFKNK